MIGIPVFIGLLSVLVAYQLKKAHKELPLAWRGGYCFFVSIVIVFMFWSPGQGVQNIGLMPAGLFFVVGLFYEVKAWINKHKA